MRFAWVVALLILLSASFASVNVIGKTATFTGGEATLVNPTSVSGDKYILADCQGELTTCRFVLDITPTSEMALSQITGKVIGKGQFVRREIYETRTIQSTVPILTPVLHYTDFGNGSSENYTTYKQTGTETVENEVTAWFPATEPLVAGVPTRIGLVFRKAPSETVDLVPSFANQDVNDWAWWNSTWTIQIPFIINSTLNLTDYQVNVSLNLSNYSSYGTDLRVTCVNASDGIQYEEGFWRRKSIIDGTYHIPLDTFYNFTNYAAGTVWIKVSHLRVGLTQCYFYLNASTAVSDNSNISTTFIYGDEFTTNTLTNWVIGGTPTVTWGGDFVQTVRVASPGAGPGYTIQPASQLNSSNISVSMDYIQTGGNGPPDDPETARTTTYQAAIVGTLDGIQGGFTGGANITNLYTDFNGGGYFNENLNVPHPWNKWFQIETLVNTTHNNTADHLNDNIVSAENFVIHENGTIYGTGLLPYFEVGGQMFNRSSGFYGMAFYTANTVQSFDNFRVRQYAGITPTVTFGEINLNAISVTLQDPTPLSGSFTNYPFVYVNATFTGPADSCTLYVNSSSYAMTTNGNNCYLNQSYLNGSYLIYVYAYNSTNASINGTSENRTFTVDTTAPNAVIFSPTAASYIYLNASILMSVSTSIGHCDIQIDGVNYTMYNASVSACGYQLNNSVGNHTIIGFVTNLAGTTSNSSPVLFSIFNYSANVSFTNPQADMAYFTPYLNFTFDNYIGPVSANFTFNSQTYVGIRTLDSFSETAIPPTVSTPTSYPLVWSFALTNTSTSITTNVIVTPSGLMACGNLSNTTAIHYTILDSVTFAPVNASLAASIVQTALLTKSNSILSAANTTHSICINPPAFSVNATINESFSATGYNSKLISRFVATYSADSANFTIFMVNSSSISHFQTIIQVIDNNRAPMEGVYVQVSQQNVTSNTYYVISYSQTDINGQTTQLLVPNSIFYKMAVYSSGGNLLQTYSPAVISCNTLSQQVCNVVLVVGQIINVPYISTYNYANASCSWDNSTGTLACTPIGSSIASTALDVILVNSTAYNSAICSQTGIGLATVTCILPTSPGNCYNFAFRGTLTTGETPDLGGGQVCIAGQPTFAQNNGTGLILTFVLLGIGALLGLAFGPSGTLIGASLGLMVAIAFSFITGIFWYAGVGGVAMLWLMAWVVK